MNIKVPVHNPPAPLRMPPRLNRFLSAGLRRARTRPSPSGAARVLHPGRSGLSRTNSCIRGARASRVLPTASRRRLVPAVGRSLCGAPFDRGRVSGGTPQTTRRRRVVPLSICTVTSSRRSAPVLGRSNNLTSASSRARIPCRCARGRCSLHASLAYVRRAGR